MASQKSPRRSRKRRNQAGVPRAVPSQRREQRAERQAIAGRDRQRRERQLGTEGERPPSPFGGLPIAEIAILAGLVALIVWLIRGGTATLIAGLIVCTLGVLELTIREHFSGYRSHSTLLAAIPSVAAAIGVLTLIGDRRDRAPLLLVVGGPIFGLAFWQLRKRFRAARQARIARPPPP